jgi:hypothetical protein
MISIFFRTLFISLLLFGSAHAQEEPVRTIYDIELNEDADIAGSRSAHLKGIATPYGDQYQVLSTQLLEPIAVGLYTHK